MRKLSPQWLSGCKVLWLSNDKVEIKLTSLFLLGAVSTTLAFLVNTKSSIIL